MRSKLAILLSMIMAAGTAMAEGMQGGMKGEAGAEPSFDELDADSDGRISKSEAEEHRVLSNVYESVDVDNSGELSEAEFARFEAATSEPAAD